jgi:hypothetical protein
MAAFPLPAIGAFTPVFDGLCGERVFFSNYPFGGTITIT